MKNDAISLKFKGINITISDFTKKPLWIQKCDNVIEILKKKNKVPEK